MTHNNSDCDDALKRALEAATHSLAGDASLADYIQTLETAQNVQDDYVARRVNNTVDMLYTITPSGDNRYYVGATTYAACGLATLRAFDADREYGAAERHADGRLPPLAMLRVGRILLLYYKRCEAYVNQDVLLGLLESVGSVELAAPVLRHLTADVEAYAAPQQHRCLPASTRSTSKRSRRADLQPPSTSRCPSICC